jgi:p-cumate 2,3-dioxygenase alpha subunit
LAIAEYLKGTHLMERLIDDDVARGIFRVHRTAMTSPEVAAAERERIFTAGWNYVGHESEIPEAGSFRRRTIAGRPLIFVRDAAGNPRVFYNTCTHRGALICRHDEGKTKTFQCFYHAWTFDTSGTVVGVPDRQSYPSTMNWDELALKSPAEVEFYRGMCFVSFVPQAESVTAYISELIEMIDLTLDSGEVMGGWRVLPGSSQYRFNANWKLMVENSIDNYHFDTVHETYKQYIGTSNKRLGRGPEGVTESRTGFALARGHGGFTMWPARTARALATAGESWSVEECAAIDVIRNDLFAAFGQERGLRMAEQSRSILIFPNVLFQDSGTGFRIRQIEPISHELTEVRQWELAPLNEPLSLRRRRLEGARTFLGPGGFASPDDLEAVESCQLGFAAKEVEWSDISRGSLSDQPRDTEELQIRNFWREWQARMDGLPASAHVLKKASGS